MRNLRKAFLEADEKLNAALEQMQKVVIPFIKQEVSKQGGVICFSKSEDWITITYDGGNHPEYYATPCSTVKSVFIKNDALYVELEDCDEYPIENVLTLDLADIASHL